MLGLSLFVVHGLLIAAAPLVAEHGLEDVRALVVVARGLSCLVTYGIFPDRGSNLCPPHRRADS